MSALQPTTNASNNVVDITLVLDTNTYASGDVLAVPQLVDGAFKFAEDSVGLMTVVLLDEDDQGQDIDLIFFNDTATLGTINSAISISDADARKIIGTVSITSADYVDLVNSQVATLTGINLGMKAADDSSRLYIAAVCRSGTPTHTASGIKMKLGFA